MLKKRTILILLCIGFIALLLFFPSVSIKGSKAGLLLWFQVLVPTLLPFFILSSLLRTLLLKKKGTLFFLGLGLFSGYPLGAKMVGEEYISGKLSYQNAIFFLAFCNQASPMFILVYLGMQALGLDSLRYTLFFIILFSSFVGSFICTRFIKKKKRYALPQHDAIEPQRLSISQQLDQIILNSFLTITKIGGYVILFSILAQFVAFMTQGNPYITILFSGILEITTGVNGLFSAAIPLGNKIVLASALTTFGGCSALAQTKSVILETGLSIQSYILCKLCSALLATIFSTLLIHFL